MGLKSYSSTNGKLGVRRRAGRPCGEGRTHGSAGASVGSKLDCRATQGINVVQRPVFLHTLPCRHEFLIKGKIRPGLGMQNAAVGSTRDNTPVAPAWA